MESGIDYDLVPGTNHLVDLDGSMAHSSHARGNKKEIVLIPTPSDDPDDPLNWSPYRKYLSVFCMVVYVYGVGVPSAAVYSVLTPISSKTGIAVADLNQGTGYMFLFFGLGCCIFQPLALQFGKRPIYLFSMLATTLIILWGPKAKDNGEYIGGKILQGLLGAPIESLCEITISDVFFEHERGTWMGVYAVALLTSNFMAPMVAGFIADGQSWEWVLYWCSIFSGVCFIILFFFMEETNFHRVVVIDDSSSVEKVDLIVSGNKKNSTAEVGTHIEPILSANENLNNEVEVIFSKPEDRIEIQHQPKTFSQKLSLIYHYEGFLLPYYLLEPFLTTCFPSVLWSGFLYGTSLMIFNVLNATSSTILSSPPYNFSSSMCGLAYISPVIFSFLFYFVSGYLADYFKITLAKRRNGISYAEDRLWVAVVYMMVVPGALILWGVGAYHQIHWFGLVFGMGCVGGTTILGCSAAVTYVVDSYKEVGASAMVVVIVIRNLISFAIGYGITPWVDNTGYQNTFIALCFISLAVISTFYLMVLFGPTFRDKTKRRYWKLVEHKRKIGAVH
ncbi:uncharacterized protein PRCAT00004240001 [Priceomyces carsonii]|uniref:uncharacterized protein n=1 Tax=Priceomyces carsonii TaxID=28549 RepID=UPI002EDB873C|nr:unnamed protein product [Priceomyces carsonii]